MMHHVASPCRHVSYRPIVPHHLLCHNRVDLLRWSTAQMTTYYFFTKKLNLLTWENQLASTMADSQDDVHFDSDNMHSDSDDQQDDTTQDDITQLDDVPPTHQPVVLSSVSSLQLMSGQEFDKAIKMIIKQDPEIITKLLANPSDLKASYEYLRAYVISGNSDDFKRMTNQDEFARDVYNTEFYR